MLRFPTPHWRDVIFDAGPNPNPNPNPNPRRAPMWQQSGTLQFCSCHGIAGFLVHELEI